MNATTVESLLRNADLLREKRVVYAHPDDAEPLRRGIAAFGLDEPVVFDHKYVPKGTAYFVDVAWLEERLTLLDEHDGR